MIDNNKFIGTGAADKYIEIAKSRESVKKENLKLQQSKNSLYEGASWISDSLVGDITGLKAAKGFMTQVGDDYRQLRKYIDEGESFWGTLGDLATGEQQLTEEEKQAIKSGTKKASLLGLEAVGKGSLFAFGGGIASAGATKLVPYTTRFATSGTPLSNAALKTIGRIGVKGTPAQTRTANILANAPFFMSEAAAFAGLDMMNKKDGQFSWGDVGIGAAMSFIPFLQSGKKIASGIVDDFLAKTKAGSDLAKLTGGEVNTSAIDLARTEVKINDQYVQQVKDSVGGADNLLDLEEAIMTTNKLADEERAIFLDAIKSDPRYEKQTQDLKIFFGDDFNPSDFSQQSIREAVNKIKKGELKPDGYFKTAREQLSSAMRKTEETLVGFEDTKKSYDFVKSQYSIQKYTDRLKSLKSKKNPTVSELSEIKSIESTLKRVGVKNEDIPSKLNTKISKIENEIKKLDKNLQKEENVLKKYRKKFDSKGLTDADAALVSKTEENLSYLKSELNSKKEDLIKNKNALDRYNDYLDEIKYQDLNSERLKLNKRLKDDISKTEKKKIESKIRKINKKIKQLNRNTKLSGARSSASRLKKQMSEYLSLKDSIDIAEIKNTESINGVLKSIKDEYIPLTNKKDVPKVVKPENRPSIPKSDTFRVKESRKEVARSYDEIREEAIKLGNHVRSFTGVEANNPFSKDTTGWFNDGFVSPFFEFWTRSFGKSKEHKSYIKRVYEMFDGFVRDKYAYTSRFRKKFDDIFSSNEIDRKAVGKLLQGQEVRANEATINSFKKARSFLDDFREMMRSKGVELGNIENYFPRILKKEVAEMIDKSNYEKFEKYFVENGFGDELAAQYAYEVLNKRKIELMRDPRAFFTKKRSLPDDINIEQLFEDDASIALSKYMEQASAEYARVKNFGIERLEVNKLVKKIFKESPKSAARIVKAMDATFHHYQNPDMVKFLGDTQVVLKMPLSFLSQVMDWNTAFVSYGFKNTIASTFEELFKYKKTDQFDFIKAIDDEVYKSVVGEEEVTSFAKRFLDFTQFTRMQQLADASLVGAGKRAAMNLLKEHQAAIKKGSQKSAYFRNRLRDFLGDSVDDVIENADEIIKKNDFGDYVHEVYASAMMRNRPVHPLEMPTAFDKGIIFPLVNKFARFSYNNGTVVWRNIIAQAANDPERAIKGLINLYVASNLTYDISQETKEWFNRALQEIVEIPYELIQEGEVDLNSSEKRYKTLIERFTDEDEDNFKSIFSVTASNILYGYGIGAASKFYNAYEYGEYRQNYLENMMGAAFGDLSTIVTVGMETTKSILDKDETMMDAYNEFDNILKTSPLLNRIYKSGVLPFIE